MENNDLDEPKLNDLRLKINGLVKQYAEIAHQDKPFIAGESPVPYLNKNLRSTLVLNMY